MTEAESAVESGVGPSIVLPSSSGRRNSLSSRETPKFELAQPVSEEGSSHHSSVVPAYPYNVSILPQNHNGQSPLVDDSGITTRLPSICVDYLSHDWAEDDVWTSWKAMTRHKSEIANGVRLENASWRTWAKQRGKLKTISPETLNWLKDSDVTWLYGPLHTAVDAVPPPKVAGTADRLGLEPLRSLSDSKKNRKPVVITKPILKYRSLSDILLPPNTPSSPILESTGMSFDEAGISIIHAKSDSNLARLNSEANRKRSSSPHVIGREVDDRGVLSDSSSSRNGDRRHISFNHRVEQCIAVDSTEEVKRYSPEESSAESDLEEDDEEEVLTFKSSPRLPSYGPSALSSAHRHRPDKEPHTIFRLGPTTLKSVEIWPHPSPAVYYQDQLPQTIDATPSVYGTATPTYSVRIGTEDPADARLQGSKAMYEYSTASSAGTSQWDEDEDYAMGFDYFNGPEVGVGDEYDMAQYGSTHLVSGAHNGYLAGASTYLPHGPYLPSLQDNGPPTPPIARGSHVPPSSKEPLSPKRSILKNRSRQNSDNSIEETPMVGNARFGSGNNSPLIVTPEGSAPSSPDSISPYSSASSLAAMMASAGVPTTIHLRETSTGIRRVDSNEVVREARGRSTSRGSSSSLERAASADRRTSSSISPSSSYSPPVFVPQPPSAAASGPRPIGIPGSRSRGNSSESLNLLGAGQMAGGREMMPGLPEEEMNLKASLESDSEIPFQGRIIVTDADIEDEGIGELPLDLDEEETIPIASNSQHLPSRYRQPLPVGTTTSTTEEEIESPPSLTNSPALDQDELSSTPWSEEIPTPSYARRSLLRAARGGGNSTGSDREGSVGGRSSIESGRGSQHDDSYGFGYYDEDSEGGIVSRTMEVAGTVREDRKSVV